MHIAYRLDYFPKLSESFVLNELVYLEKLGHTVSIFADRKPKETVDHDRLSDLSADVAYATSVSLRNVIQGVRHRKMAEITWKEGIKNTAWRAGRVGQFLEFLAEEKEPPDLIHGHFATEIQTEARIAADILNCKQTVTVHAYDIFREDMRDNSRSVLEKADHIITVSEYNTQYIQNELGINKEISIIPAGFFVEDFIPAESSNPFHILTVSRCVEKKGLKYGIRAVAEVSEEYDVEYRIIGEGKLLPELKRQVTTLGVSDSVDFLGYVSDERLFNELDKAGIFLLPCVIGANGNRDSMPVVLKEAMAMETACISTTVSAIPELIEHEEDGLLVPPKNAKKLAGALERLLSDDSLRKKITSNAPEKAKQYDIERLVPQLESVFQDII